MSTPLVRIPIAKPWMGEAEHAAARRPIMSGWVTQGPEVAAFEAEFAQVVGAAHACAVSNCTTALHLALLAVGVKPGDEVVTVSHSFIATANAIRYCGATPVLVDIQPETFNIDPERVIQALGPKTRAIVCVHQMGMPCDLHRIVEAAEARGIPVIEDAACAIGSEILWAGRWERIGRPRGAIACFSFHPRKVITTGDGGMITTSNEEWDQQFRLWRQHGMSIPDTVRHSSADVVFESYPVLGFNYRMTDIQAAIGREQLKRLPETLERRRALAARYKDMLADVPGLVLPAEPIWARTNWQGFCVRLPNNCDQRHVMQKLLDEGIASRRAIMCIHREPAYANGHETWSYGPQGEGGRQPNLHQSEKAQDRAVIIPLFHEMTDADQWEVVTALRQAVAGVTSLAA